MNLLDTGIEKGLIWFDLEKAVTLWQAQGAKLSKKEIGEIIKDDKAKVQQSFTDKVYLLEEELTEKYFIARQQALSEVEMLDYPIFMAIAEDIGYDATGRSTNNNELIEIGKGLSKFIAHINKTEK